MGNLRTLTAERIVDILPPWSDGEGPLYRRLAGSIRAGVERGQLPPGTRLPPERRLADALAVSRSTVVATYQLLKDEGWIESRQGSGTWIQWPEGRAAEREGVPSRLIEGNPIHQRFDHPPATNADLSASGTPGSPLVAEEFAALTETEVATLTSGHGYSPRGLIALRRAVVRHLAASQRLEATTEEVLVTAGAQQAIFLVATLFLEPGDRVVVEETTYPGGLDAFRQVGATLEPLRTTAQGPDLDHLEQLLAGGDVTLVFLTPTFHNPTGSVMPASARRRLAELVAAAQVPLLENVVLADLAHTNLPVPPSVASFAPDAPILTVGSASKLFWGGLRTGWLRGPTPTIGALTRIKTKLDVGSPILDQLVTARLLERAGEAVRLRRAELSAQLRTLETTLAEVLPEWSFTSPAGGLTVWAKLPRGSATAFSRAALRHGVVTVAGPVFSVEGRHDDHVRLPFVLPPDRLRPALHALAEAWREFDERLPGSATEHVLV